MYKPATREGTFLLIGLTGQQGTGKTGSALRIARGLVGPEGKIAVADTENRRATHFIGETLAEGAPEIAFDHLEVDPPFSPKTFLDAVNGAEKEGYGVLIIDSFSHEWEGIGGVIEWAEEIASNNRRQQPSFGDWRKPKMEHKRLVNGILQSKMHVIICMRGKVKREQITQDGKQVVVERGIVPIQEERFLYEMTVHVIMQDDQTPVVQKCPHVLRPVFPKGKHLTEAAGEALVAWMKGGEPVDPDTKQQIAVCKDLASEGTASLRRHFQFLQENKEGMIARLKSVPGLMDLLHERAAEADRQAAAGEDDAPQPVQDNPLGANGADDSNPFDEEAA